MKAGHAASAEDAEDAFNEPLAPLSTFFGIALDYRMPDDL